MRHSALVMSGTQVALLIIGARASDKEGPPLWTDAKEMAYHDPTE